MLFVPGTQDFERPRNLMISLRPGVGIREFDWSHLTKVFGNHSYSLEIQNMYSGPVNPALEAKEEFELNQFLEFYRPKIFKIHTKKVAEILKKNNINDDLDLHVIPVTDNEDFYRILSLPQEMSISESTTPVILLPPKTENTTCWHPKRAKKKHSKNLRTMRISIAILLLFHAILHLMGLVKAFYSDFLPTLSRNISKGEGVLWFTSFAILVLANILFLTGNSFWPFLGVIGALLSQFLISLNWEDAKYGTILNLLILGISFPALT